LNPYPLGSRFESWSGSYILITPWQRRPGGGLFMGRFQALIREWTYLKILLLFDFHG